MLNYAAQELHHRALRDQAAEILRYLDTEPDGTPRLSLPAALTQFYSQAYGRSAFVVLDRDGRVLFSSPAGDHPIVRGRPQTRPFEYFALRHDGADAYGVTVSADVGGHPLMVQVLEDLSHRDVLIDDIVNEFLTRVGWITAPILLVLLIIDVVIFRRALRPIITASALAERIGPAPTEPRPPVERMPREAM